MDELYENIYSSFKSMIISVSGWRKIFAADGNETSMEKNITEADRILCAGIGYIFSKWVLSKGYRTIVAGRDTRPTGEEICGTIIKIMEKAGLRIKYLSVCAAPEIMAYVKNLPEAEGFIYVSASHNPPGHNGVKFGLGDGCVAGKKESGEIISMFKSFMEKRENYALLSDMLGIKSKCSATESRTETAETKEGALKSYLAFSLSTAFPDREDLKNFIMLKKPAVIADMNGSARSLSVDRDFFRTLRIKTSFINDVPGKIVHGILPEGKNLSYAAEWLEKKYRSDNSFTLGYMPDNDGDRGNIVYINTKTGKAEIPDAQTVFALACAAELSFMEYSGMLIPDKTAVAANCPTSMRIEKIAEKFKAKVFRCEVGEANAVSLGTELRKKGFIVRFLGEGSNGGNITWPSSVRDPLNTMIALIKFSAITSIPGRAGLFEIWCKKAGVNKGYDFSKAPGIEEIISSLPEFMTTPSDDKLAKMQIKTTRHGLLKSRYEKIFQKEWQLKKKELAQKFGFGSWREVNCIGTKTVEGTGPETRRRGTRGGLKIIFSDLKGADRGFIWMRGSGTEPIFRIVADIESSLREDERYLIKWQREMVEKADRGEI